MSLQLMGLKRNAELSPQECAVQLTITVHIARRNNVKAVALFCGLLILGLHSHRERIYQTRNQFLKPAVTRDDRS